ncbi:MAG: hypothetical protein ACT4O2_12960 [Beijerinckiaceae bacterium]
MGESEHELELLYRFAEKSWPAELQVVPAKIIGRINVRHVAPLIPNALQGFFVRSNLIRDELL